MNNSRPGTSTTSTTARSGSKSGAINDETSSLIKIATSEEDVEKVEICSSPEALQGISETRNGSSSPVISPASGTGTGFRLTLRSLGSRGETSYDTQIPGAYALDYTEGGPRRGRGSTQGSSRSQRIPESLVNSPVVAELVEDSEAAAQNEINRLRHELDELRLQQQQQSAQVVLAEPIELSEMDNSSTRVCRTSHRCLVKPKMKATTAIIGAEAGKEVSIYEPSKEIEGTKHNSPSDSKHLKIPSLNLHGRGQETHILQACLNNTHQKQLVMISGCSGCGKTALALSLKPTVLEQQGLFVSGKFDLYLRDQPYYGIISACQEICTAILSLRDSYVRKQSFPVIHDLLNSALPTRYIQILSQAIPGFKDITGHYDEASRDTDQGVVTDQGQKHCFLSAFCIFLKVASTFFSPLVIMLDDLQWADAASLELMQAILADRENHRYLMIGVYRSNEVFTEESGLETHPLAEALLDLKEKREDLNLVLTEIDIGNLNEENVKSLVMELLSLKTDSKEATELATICHKRTLGNVFFLLSYLSMLENDGLLEYDSQSGMYAWDNERIKGQTGATSNLVDLMKRKMVKLPQQMAKLLSIAACLGSTFHQSKLEMLVPLLDLTRNQLSNTSVQERLCIAVEEGFLEHLDDRHYSHKWIHDKVQEAAFSLVPGDEASNFKFQIGSVLSKEMDKKELEEDLFMVVNLLNQTPKVPLNNDQKLHLAELNLQATKKALSCSAFASAARYASKGCQLVHGLTDQWTDNYDLTLALYSTAVESNELLGKYDKVKMYGNEVLGQQKCPFVDKLRVYRALASQMSNSGKHVEAHDLMLEVLSSLGCKFPKIRWFAILLGVIKFRLALRKRTPEEISGLVFMQDPTKIQTMKFLEELGLYSYLCDTDLYPLTVFKGANMTLRHGVCEGSSPAFAAVAMILTGVVDDLRGGFAYGNYALLLEKKMKSGVSCSRVKCMIGGYVFPWSLPFQEVRGLLLESYSEGMIHGDTEFACYGIMSYLALSLMAGTPLRQVEADCSTYCKQMKDLKRKEAHDLVLIVWQSVINLMGATAEPTRLEGDILRDLKSILDDTQRNPHSRNVLATTRTHQLKLFVLYGDYERAANLFMEHGYDWPKVGPGNPQFMDDVFFGGIASFATARSTGKRKFKRHAMKARSTVKGWARQSNIFAHHEAFLDAELAALQKKMKKAEKNYQSAIAIAIRGGFIHHAALANSRYGEFMLVERSDKDSAAFQFKEAIRLYNEWGAAKKVELLQKKYGSLWFHKQR